MQINRFFLVFALDGTNLNYELIRGALHVASSNAIPISTTFLLLDRIQAVSIIPAVKWWRTYAAFVSIIAICSLFTGNFSLLYYRTILHPFNTSECEFPFKERGF